jgi:catechol 2,3-dioxygenase-like lactoylglutathione lyase family enzyme
VTAAGLHHVALPTLRADVDAEVAFWSLLGFSPVNPPDSLRDRATWLQAPDGTQIHLLYTSEPAHAGHTAVITPDFDTTITTLTAAGFRPEPRTQHWGEPRSYVRSPGGHLVEMMAFPPS